MLGAPSQRVPGGASFFTGDKMKENESCMKKQSCGVVSSASIPTNGRHYRYLRDSFPVSESSIGMGAVPIWGA
jgi:hypothetical protein